MRDPQFDWSIEEQEAWDDAQAEGLSSSLRVRRPVMLIVLLALLVIVLLICRVVMLANAGAARVESAARASAELFVTSAVAQDIELFSTVVSDQDPQWKAAQQHAIATATLFGRKQFDWVWDGTAPEIIEVTLDGVLQSAEFTATLNYGIAEQTATLQLPFTMRQGPTGWLHSRPQDPAWLATEQQRASHLNAIFPPRDRQIMQRLIPDLNNIVRYSGAVEFGDIPPERQIFIFFKADPHWVSATQKRTVNETIELAAPSSIGIPTNEVGYQALLRYYAAHIYMPVMAARDLYDCCDHALWFEAIVDWELARRGIIAWPLSTAQYAEIASDPEVVDLLLPSWQASDADPVSEQTRHLVYAVVQQIGEARPDMLPREMSRSLREHDTVEAWLATLISAETVLPDTVLGRLMHTISSDPSDVRK